jgi:hypothetical protein
VISGGDDFGRTAIPLHRQLYKEYPFRGQSFALIFLIKIGGSNQLGARFCQCKGREEASGTDSKGDNSA